METPPPLVTREGVKPFPPTGARTLNARTAIFYYAHRHHAGDDACGCPTSARST